MTKKNHEESDGGESEHTRGENEHGGTRRVQRKAKQGGSTRLSGPLSWRWAG